MVQEGRARPPPGAHDPTREEEKRAPSPLLSGSRGGTGGARKGPGTSIGLCQKCWGSLSRRHTAGACRRRAEINRLLGAGYARGLDFALTLRACMPARRGPDVPGGDGEALWFPEWAVGACRLWQAACSFSPAADEIQVSLRRGVLARALADFADHDFRDQFATRVALGEWAEAVFRSLYL